MYMGLCLFVIVKLIKLNIDLRVWETKSPRSLTTLIEANRCMCANSAALQLIRVQ